MTLTEILSRVSSYRAHSERQSVRAKRLDSRERAKGAARAYRVVERKLKVLVRKVER